MQGATANSPLAKLRELIEKGKLKETIDYRGTQFVFKSLNDEEYAWRDQFVSSASIPAMISSQRAPTLAIATVSIDGVPVETLPELTVLEGVPAREIGDSQKYVIAYHLREYFAGLPKDYIDGLFAAYIEKVEGPARKLSEEDVKNS